MKKYIFLFTFLILTQKSYCAENKLINLAHVYYPYQRGPCYPSSKELEHVFPHAIVNKKSDYAISDRAFLWKILPKKIYHSIAQCFFGTQTPYVFLNQEDLEWLSSEDGNHYVPCNDDLEPCPDKEIKVIFFTIQPHCGDLAHCIRQAKEFEGKDKLLQLVDASYDVQKLVRFDDETFPKMCHFVHFRTETMSLINKFLTKTYSQYTFQNYRSNVQEIFFQAIFSYSITIIENLMILFLIYNQKLPAYVQYPVFGIFILLKMRIAISLQDACMNLSHLITIFCIIGLEAGLFNDMIYYCEKIFYYQKILFVCWIIHSSFFLIMLYYKYSKFKKVMNNYEDHYKIIALLNEEKMRKKKTILL